MKIRNIYNQITAHTIQDLWLYKGDLRYFGNRGWQSLFPDYSKNFEEINTQIDTINKQLDAIESTTASINYDSNTKKIQLLSNGSVISEIDATVFIKGGGTMTGPININDDFSIDSSGSTVVFDGAHVIQFKYGTDEVDVIRLGSSSINVGWTGGETGDVLLEGNNIYRHTPSDDKYTIYDSGNFKAGTNYVAPSTLNNYLPLSGGTLTGILKVPYTGIQTDGGNSIIFFNSSELFIGNSNFRGIWETTNQDLIHRRVDANYTIIDTYNTFNTITYTTSASEDNLRAWNNYVNGYVTNLRIVDSELTSYIRVVNGVDIENKKFDVSIIGGNPVRLVRVEYTLADNGSVTKSTNSYTLTPVTV